MTYTESDSRIGRCQEGRPGFESGVAGAEADQPKGLVLPSGFKNGGCPTPAEPILASRAVYPHSPLLQVEDFHVTFSTQGAPLYAVRGVSFDVFPNESVGIVGESGCGKSALVQALVGLSPATSIRGKALFNGENLLEKNQSLLGTQIGMVFQDPMTCLNPTMTILAQVMEGMLYHQKISRKKARRKAIELLRKVGIDHPEEKCDQYPHQWSGGMRQRALIAIGLALNPKLLIADEPTTALDATVQAQVLDLLKGLQQEFQMSLLLITHDFSVIAKMCQNVLVFYAGKIVEKGPVHEILHHPRHPYTRMLLASIPDPLMARSSPLKVIEGVPPSLTKPPSGCSFAARCPEADALCTQDPPFFGSAACWRCQQ